MPSIILVKLSLSLVGGHEMKVLNWLSANGDFAHKLNWHLAKSCKTNLIMTFHARFWLIINVIWDVLSRRFQSHGYFISWEKILQEYSNVLGSNELPLTAFIFTWILIPFFSYSGQIVQRKLCNVYKWVFISKVTWVQFEKQPLYDHNLEVRFQNWVFFVACVSWKREHGWDLRDQV